MAFASIGSLGTSVNTTANQASTTLTTTAAIEAGNLAVIIIGVDNHQTGDGDGSEIASVSDSQGAWTKAHEWRNGGTGAQAGVVIALWYKRFSTTLASSSVITVTFSSGSSASRDKSACEAWEFSCAANVEVEAISQNVDDGVNVKMTLDATTANIECLRIRAQCGETNAAGGALLTSGWTFFNNTAVTSGGAGSANVAVGAEFRIATGTSFPSTEYANSQGSDKVAIYVALKESAPSNALVGTSSLAFSNTAALSGSGALSGTSAPAFANTAALRGLAPIAGTVTASFAATAAMQAGLAASGVVTISFSNTAALTGTFATSGAGAITVPKQLASGTATRTVPQYAGAGAVAIPVQAAAGTATRTVPQYAGAGTATIPLQAASGAATTTAPPQYAGAGAVTIPLQAASGTGGLAPAGPADFGSLYAWYTAHTNAFMTVNDDGTGGSPSSGGSAGRLTDRGPNGKHLAQSSSPSRPIFRTGKGLNFFWKTAGGHVNASLLNTSISLDAQDTSGGAIFDLPGQNATPLVALDETSPSNAMVIQTGLNGSPFLGYNYSGSTGKYTTGRKLVVTWRSNGSNLIIRCNGEEYTASANAAVTLGQLKLGTFAGGSPKPSRLYELVLYDEDIGDTNLLALETYLRDLVGSLSSTHSVVVFGDSMSMGVGSETNAPWHDQISNRSGSRWHNFAGDGQVLYAPHVTTTQINSLKGSTEGVVVVWSGTNDIYAGLKTGVETEENLAAFCADLKAGGNKVIVATLPHFSFNDDERIIFNALVKANYTDYADAIVLLDEVPELSDASDTTYFTGDGVHLKDPGHAAAAPLFEAALESLTYVGLGDVKPGAVFYQGLRAYSAATIGADAVRLRRALDNAEQDFETIEAGLDLAAIASFASSTDLFVRWLYDQIGTNHLGEATAARQSKFILSGPNGLPAIESTAGVDQGLISAESNALAQPLSFVTYAKNIPAGTYVYMLFEVGTGALAFGFDNLAAGDTWIGTGAFIFPTVPCSANVYHSLQYVFNDDESDIVVDGEDNFPLDLGDTTGLLGDGPLYVPYHDSTPYGAGITFTELALYGEALSSEDKTAINANQQAYWNPPEPEEYAGDGAVTIPLQLAAGSGGAAVAQYAGAGAITVPKQLASGAATRTVPQYVGTGAVTTPKQLASGAATRTVPQYVGTGAVATPKQLASGAATRTVPQSVGTGAVTIPKQLAAGSGGAAIPQYAGAGAVTTPLQLASGAAVRTLPVVGTGAVTTPKQLASGAATRTVPQYVGTGAVTVPKQLASGAATRTVPQYVGTGAVTTPKQLASGAAVRTLPVAGAGAVTIPKQLATGQGGAAVAQYAGTGAITVPKQLASGAATRTVPQRTGTGAVTTPKQLASGAATRTVPQYAGTGAVNVPKQLAAGAGVRTGPQYVGAGSATIPKQLASGAASYTLTPRVGDGAIIVPKQLVSGAGTRTVPQFVGDGAVIIPAFIIAGSASITVIAPRQPTIEGTAGRSEFSSGRRSSMFEEDRPQSSASGTRRASKLEPGRRG